MAVKRKRYFGTSRVQINSVSIEGQELMFMGECNLAGKTKCYKKYKTHVLLKFTDKKWLRENNLLMFEIYKTTPDSLSRHFIAEDDM